MNLALWVAQWLLALSFLLAGAFKLLAYGEYATLLAKNGTVAVTRWLAGFIGIAEIVGGLGVVLPMAINVAPALSPWAALGLASIMLLAIGYHLRSHEPAPAPIMLLALSAFVAFGRFSHLA